MRPTKARAATIAEALSTAEREMLTTVFIRKKTWSRSKNVAEPAINQLVRYGVLRYAQDLLTGKMVHVLTRQLGRWVLDELRK